MNKNKFLKVLLALFAVTLLAVSCADKPTTPENDAETPNNTTPGGTKLPELGIIVTDGTATNPLEVTLDAASDSEDSEQQASARTQAEKKVIAKVTLGEGITKGIAYEVTGVSSLNAEPSTATRTGNSSSLVEITETAALQEGNYEVKEKEVVNRNGDTEISLDVTLKAAALTAVETDLNKTAIQSAVATAKYGYIVLTLKATKDDHQDQENIQIYVKITAAAGQQR